MAQWWRTTDTTVTGEVTSLTAESQQYGDTLIRLSEYSVSRPLSQYQKEVLLKQQQRLKLLGIELIPTLEGTLHLRAPHIVGAARFVQGRSQVTVQVEPRLGQADFLRMLDYTLTRIRTDQQQVDIGVEVGGATGLLLQYFADMVLSFLQKQHYRSYTFITNEGSNKVKGKLLTRPYMTRSLPRAEPHIVPCQYLDYTSNVLENQIIAYSVYIATQLTSLLPDRVQRGIKEKLALCTRLLKGISVRRVTLSEIKRIRYNRLNTQFQHLHQLCSVILQNQSISLGPTERIPFLSFTTDMTALFEGYVASLFRHTFRENFVYQKAKLRHPVDALGYRIELDGLLLVGNRKYVVECKYAEVKAGSDDHDKSQATVSRAHVYQALTYATHVDIQASGALLVYPAWTQDTSRILVSVTNPITVFGWHPAAHSGRTVIAIGIDLTARFEQLSESIRHVIATIDQQAQRYP